MPRPLCSAPVLCVVAVLCLVASINFLLPTGLQIPGEDVTAISLTAGEVDEFRSVYLPLFPLSLSVEERDEWVAVVSMSEDERAEMCRQVDDPEFVHLFDTMLTRARGERLGAAVVQQLKVDLATYSSLDVCTAEDLSFVERLEMSYVLVEPQQWTRMEEAVRAVVARAGSTLITFPAKVGWGVGGILRREITSGSEWERGPPLGNTTKEEDVNIGTTLGVGKRGWLSTGQDEVCAAAREQQPHTDTAWGSSRIKQNFFKRRRDLGGLNPSP